LAAQRLTDRLLAMDDLLRLLVLLALPVVAALLQRRSQTEAEPTDADGARR
jgi:hypothetical protein